MYEILMDYVSIGNRIREKRKEIGLTQDQLGELVSLSSTHISHIENGKTKISFEKFIRICNILQVSADELLQENLTHNDLFYHNEIAGLIKECTTDELKELLRILRYIMRIGSSKRP